MEGLSQDQFFAKIGDIVTHQVSELEKRLTSSQKDISEKQLNKIEKLTENHEFKSKGNEDQYKVNRSVIAALNDATTALKQNNVEEATNSVNKGMDTLMLRQKMIKIADSSDGGWRTVAEYKSNELAENSEDEKKIRKADQRASSKLKADKQKKQKKLPYVPRTATVTRAVPVDQGHVLGGGSRPGRCFACGKLGHWRKDHVGANVVKRPGSDNQISDNLIRPVDYEALSQGQVCNVGVITPGNVKDTGGLSGDIQKPSLSDDKGSKLQSPAGSLHGHLDQWTAISANTNVLDIIESGYKIPFYTDPPSCVLNNNKSALQQNAFVVSEIGKLLRLGCISEVSSPPKVVNPLTVADNGSKLRLVLDARHINPHVYKFAHRFEGSDVACQLFSRDDFLFSFDLKSAYHHLEIFDDHRTYLGFSWIIDGKTRYFIYNVLPFGLSTAGYVFSKVLRCVVTHWRANGLKVIMYLDDGIGCAGNFSDAFASSCRIKADLTSLGFLIAEDKCVWYPAQRLTWLGLVWDTRLGKVFVTDKRMSSLVSGLKGVLSHLNGSSTMQVKQLASVAGKIISMHVALGPVVRLRTRSIYECMSYAASWTSVVFVSELAKSELVFWHNRVHELNGVSFCADIAADVRSTRTMYTDASDTGYGGFVVGDASEVFSSWNLDESEESSTWRELEAIRRVFLVKKDGLFGKTVRLCTDSKNAAHIVSVGSKKPGLQKIAIDLADESNGTNFTPVWVPRANNVKADRLSRKADVNDWSISHDVFSKLDLAWGPHVLDVFASGHNAKCNVFFSESYCEGTSGIDGFKQSWVNGSWLVPPPKLAAKCIKKMSKECVDATLVVPLWKSAPFWPLLCVNDDFQTFVKESFPFSSSSLIPSSGRNGIFGLEGSTHEMIALKIRF